MTFEQGDLIVIDEEENNSFMEDKFSVKSSKDTFDLNKDLVIDSKSYSINTFKSESSFHSQESFQSILYSENNSSNTIFKV
ncbi:9031_t:CDS:1, partial [Funneliformis mosseae]